MPRTDPFSHWQCGTWQRSPPALCDEAAFLFTSHIDDLQLLSITTLIPEAKQYPVATTPRNLCEITKVVSYSFTAIQIGFAFR